MIARRMGQVLTYVVLGLSATYMLVYLYRWEWNRALVAGLFFVSAEVAAVATSLLNRLRHLEQRLDEPGRGAPAPEAAWLRLARLQETAPQPTDRFAWLEESARRTNVFVPVLLGAGVLLSLLAHGIERLSSATASPHLERRLAGRLDVIALPSGGLLGPAVARPVPPPAGLRLARRAFVAGVLALLVLGGIQAVDLIADATQTRSDPQRAGATELTVRVSVEGRTAGRDATAEALWVACRNTVNRRVQATPMTEIGSDTYRFVVSPAIGDHARRRLEGCIEDATLDRTSARVLSMIDVTGTAVP